MKKISITLLMMLLVQISLLAQNNHSIYGMIREDDGTPLVNAVISFCNAADSTRQYPTVCDLKGYFKQILPAGRYVFNISYMGLKYYPKNNRIEIQTNDIDLKEIRIKLAVHELKEVTVVGSKPFVLYKGNKAIYNLAANPAAVGGSLLDGIKLLPGVQIKDDNSLSVYGFYDLTVAVNHQVLKLSKEETSLYLSSMSVGDIESVELIRNPGPEYGQQVVAVLDIMTKRKAEDGMNAFLSTDATYQKDLSERALARMNFNKSMTKNYISYNFSQVRRQETLKTDIDTDNSSISPRNMHQLQLGSDITVSPKYTVGVRSLLSFTDEHFVNNNIRAVDLNMKSLNLNLYNNLLGTKWRWTTNLDFTGSRSSRNYENNNQFAGKNKDKYGYGRFESDYSYRFSPSFSSQVGVILNQSSYKIESSEKEFDIDYKEFNTAAFLSFYYRKNNIDANGGIQVNRDKRTNKSFEKDLPTEPVIWNWQPYFNIGYNVAANHRVSFAFSTYYNRPAFRDLLPYVSSSSSFLNRTGNPNLTNSTRYNLALTYTFMRAAMLELSFSDEKKPIVEYLTQRNEMYLLTKTNLDRSRYGRVLVGLPIPIINKKNGLQWIASTYFAYHHQQDKGMINNEGYNKSFNACYIQHKHSISLPSQWYIDGQVTYYSPLFFGVYKTEKQWWIDFNISKRINNWKFTLSGHDLFNTNIARGELNGQAQKIFFEKNWHCPKITFGISLTIGNKSFKAYKDRKTIDAEKRVNQNVDESISINTK